MPGGERVEGGRDPLDTPPPSLPVDEARTIAERVFGVRGSVSALRSERDQNFRVDAESGRGYVLKVSNPADDRSVIEMQAESLLHVRRQGPDLPVMRLLPTPDGALWGEIPGPRDDPLLVRMFTLMPGRMVRPGELDHRALARFGRLVARMGLALRGFFHPAADYEILWDLKHAPRLRPLLDAVEEPGRRSLAEGVLDRFEERVAPVLDGLRAQVIHNDLTIDNVLLDDGRRVSGIVDFGDLTHTALVCDLAIALASLMWERPDPFEAAAAAIRGYVEVLPLEEPEVDLLGDLVAARVAAWGVIAAWRVRRFPDNTDYITAGDDAAWRLLEDLDRIGPPEVGRRLRETGLDAPLPYRRVRSEELLERRRRVLRRSPLTYERPVHLVRGEGVWMFDPHGRRYLDAYNNVPVVGHGHPRVTAAVAEQARRLNTNTRYLHEAAVELAERLVATMPGDLDTVLFVNSGSEANDVAWRLARAATGGDGAIVTEHAYHGITEATAALSPEEWARGECPGHVELVPAPDGYRGRYRREDGGWAERYAAHVGEAVARLRERPMRLAAMFVDPASTSDGVLVPPDPYLRGVAPLVREAGGLLVADEVQAGHGRYGSHLWSFQASGVEPDIVTLGKPMGNGHPVAAVVTRAEILDALTRDTELFSTFGGNPVSCSAALAVLEVIEEEALMQRAATVGAYLRRGFERLSEAHVQIGDVRGEGLLIGVELVRDRQTREPARQEAGAVVNTMRERGVLLRSTGPEGNVLKIRPPLVFTGEHADLLLGTLAAVLDDVDHR
ncbi:MAG: aminotransferase class III-fold pyridoxal phosphate-dependent enzyme [Actinomycetota bacterium]